MTVPGAADGSVMVGDGPDAEARGPGRTHRRPDLVGTVVALAAWVAVVVVARWVGRPSAEAWSVRSVPLMGGAVGKFLPIGPWVLAAGLVLAVALPWVCARLRWRQLLGVLAMVAVAWGLALVLIRGPGALERSMANRHEYVAVVDDVDDIGIGRFVDTFTDPDVLAGYPIHVQGHPLGAPLVFVGLDRVGLRGPLAAMAFLVAASAVTAPAVLVAARAVAGEAVARRAAPFLVLGPGAIWTVTSADALFAAVGAAAIALVVVAACRDCARSGPASGRDEARKVVADVAGDRPSWSPRRVALTALAGGALFGVGLEISYGLVPLILVPVAVAAWYRRWSVLGWAALGGALVLGGVGIAGFWWFDGIAATRVRYEAGIADVRPRGYFTFLGNPAAFALCLGPAAAVGLAHLRDRRLALLVVPAVLAVLAADLSGLSKGEVERIWLPFAPWILLATGSLGAASLTTTSRTGGPPAECPPGTVGPVAASSSAAEPLNGSSGGGPITASSAVATETSSTAGPGPLVDTASADRGRTSPLVPILLAAQVALAVAIESTIRTPW